MGQAYQKLANRQIRVLVLEPGQPEEPINGSLEIQHLEQDAHDSYETISYCWGDSSQRRWISLNGTRIDVPFSSDEALKCVRYQDKARRVWIDAICINQADLDERAQQVTLMAAIYGNGFKNLIFLGPEKDVTAAKACMALAKANEKLESAVSLLSDTERQGWNDGRHTPDQWGNQAPLLWQDILSLEPLFEVSWFTRLWVVQEAFFARENRCYWGQEEFALQWVIDIASFKNYSTHDSHRWSEAAQLGQNIAGEMHQMVDRPQELNLSNLLQLVQLMSTSERHDRIFAIKDMIRNAVNIDDSEGLLVADYHKPIGEVFRDATLYILIYSPMHDVLDYISHRDDADISAEGKTSWTIAWDRVQDMGQDQSYPGVLASAGTLHDNDKMSFEVDAQHSRDVLVTRGLLLSEPIQGTTSASGELDSSSSSVAPIVDPLMRLIDSQMGPAYDAYKIAAVLLMGTWRWASQDGLDDAALSLRELFDPSYSKGSWYVHEYHQMMRRQEKVLTSVATSSSHRCFFTAGPGLIGSGPKVMRDGDRVAIFKGAQNSYVLRPTGMGDNSFYFLGVALVIGLMEGEVFDMGLEEREIRLR